MTDIRVVPVRNMLAPPNLNRGDNALEAINQGPRVIPEILTLGAGVTYTLSFADEQNEEQINNVQTICVDNSDGANTVTISTENRLFNYEVPAGSYAILPLILDELGRVQFTRADAGNLPIALLNIPLPAVVWNATNNDATIIAQLTTLLEYFEPATQGNRSSVPADTVSTQLLDTNTNRHMATFFNDSTATAYLSFSTTSSLTNFTVEMLPRSYYEMPYRYTGKIAAIWTAATGNMRVTEFV